ncbi:MAG: enolase C-terminal domain-like protein [Dehalococcoidia bacterium]|nr:enolase C-terminal domain-like protein [Dehalococcoidia bacterium]
MSVSGEWFAPTELEFSAIHVRAKTEWAHLSLGDGSGTVGQGEITSTQLASEVASTVARLANRIRGRRLSSDTDVIALNGLTTGQLEEDQVLATAVSGLRCAVTDALAQRAQLPLVDYLRALYDHEGTPERSVQLYSNINRSMLPDDNGPVDRSPDSFAEMASRAMEAGFTTAKCAPFDECKAPFKSTGLPREAEPGLERIRAAKAVIGPERTLLVDCHSRFDLESGLALEPELREAGVGWYEEPVDPIHDTDDLRKIRDNAELPIAGAEHGYGVALFTRLMEEDALDVVMPDVKFCGGPAEAYLIGSELEARWDSSVSMHCPSGPLSLLASAHATAAFGNKILLEHAVYEVEWRHEAMEPFEQVESGYLVLPDGFGLGGRVDPVAVAMRGRSWTE